MSCGCFSGSVARRRQNTAEVAGGVDGDLLQGVKHFSYKQLKLATNNFHSRNKLGCGFFGPVYKGVLKDGTKVAVRRLSLYPIPQVAEFLRKIKPLLDVKHINLVQLIGCCVEGNDRILVEEYVKRKSLDQVLLADVGSRKMKLDWSKRSSICMGIARGLAFLHQQLVPCIGHVGIKSSNIFVDKDFNPKIGDLALAKLEPEQITNLTFRYSAPELVTSDCCYIWRADVYSFGVLVLEIISGRNNLEQGEALVLQHKGRLMELVDPRLGTKFDEEEAIRMIKTGILFSNPSPELRPIMSEVVNMLEAPTTLLVPQYKFI